MSHFLLIPFLVGVLPSLLMAQGCATKLLDAFANRFGDQSQRALLGHRKEPNEVIWTFSEYAFAPVFSEDGKIVLLEERRELHSGTSRSTLLLDLLATGEDKWRSLQEKDSWYYWWSRRQDQPRADHRFAVFSGDGSKVALLAQQGCCSSQPPSVLVFDVASGKALFRKTVASLQEGSEIDHAISLAFLDGADIIAVTSTANKLYLINAIDGELKGVFQGGNLSGKSNYPNDDATRFLIETSDPYLAVTLDNEKNPRDTQENGQAVYVLNYQTHDWHKVTAYEGQQARQLVFAKNIPLLAVNLEKRVELFGGSNWESLGDLNSGLSRVKWLDLSANGEYLVALGTQSPKDTLNLKIIEIESGEAIHSLVVSEEYVPARTAMSAFQGDDGNWIVAISDTIDKEHSTLRLYRAGRRGIRQIGGYQKLPAIAALAFNPGGTSLMVELKRTIRVPDSEDDARAKVMFLYLEKDGPDRSGWEQDLLDPTSPVWLPNRPRLSPSSPLGSGDRFGPGQWSPAGTPLGTASHLQNSSN